MHFDSDSDKDEKFPAPTSSKYPTYSFYGAGF